MNIQDLNVGDRLLVYYCFPDIFEVEVLEIRGQNVKLQGINGEKFWKTDFSDWTLIEKLHDAKPEYQHIWWVDRANHKPMTDDDIKDFVANCREKGAIMLLNAHVKIGEKIK